MPCSKCGTEVADNVRDCPTCGNHHGFPNVKVARAERSELEARARAAAERAAQRGHALPLTEFEQAAGASHAVINVDVGFLHQLLSSHKVLYGAYRKQVAGRIRVPAAEEDDRHRTAVEGVLFGSWGEEIAYAALALNQRGLESYGAACLKLKDEAIEDRASVLEENSYRFVQRHRLVPGDRLPRGFRAAWQDRARLATAKLGDRIGSTTTNTQHPKLMLQAGATRDEDEFMEVHIFGPIAQSAVAAVTLQKEPSNSADEVLVEAARAESARLGIAWRT